jgi:mannose-6-phosphate isomerase-like protein (cupin superfamily)
MACVEAAEAATPIIRLAVETMASFEPRTAARSQPVRWLRWSSECVFALAMTTTLTTRWNLGSAMVVQTKGRRVPMAIDSVFVRGLRRGRRRLATRLAALLPLPTLDPVVRRPHPFRDPAVSPVLHVDCADDVRGGTPMTDVKAKHYDQMPHYQGPNAIPGIKFHSAGRELGVTAWGMNVIAIEPGCVRYPEHDHTKDGQEEVYVVLRGGGTLKAGEEERQVETGMLLWVGPGQQRKFLPGPDGIVLLAIGGKPGEAYKPR